MLVIEHGGVFYFIFKLLSSFSCCHQVSCTTPVALHMYIFSAKRTKSRPTTGRSTLLPSQLWTRLNLPGKAAFFRNAISGRILSGTAHSSSVGSCPGGGMRSSSPSSPQRYPPNFGHQHSLSLSGWQVTPIFGNQTDMGAVKN